jgi:Holliday junction DNA helicase RuvB subunit
MATANSDPQIVPNTFDEFVGQDRLKRRLQLAIDAARHRGESLDHVLLVGPPGSGKATLARIISKEIGAKVTGLTGMTTGSVGDFVGLLTQLESNDVFFIEDLHSLGKNAAEFLCEPMKDFKMGILIDSGVKARAITLNLPRFSLVSTTTRKDRIPTALLSSFQIIEELEPYTQDQLATIAGRVAKLLDVRIDAAVARQIASTDCSSPRDILNRVRHLRDYLHIVPGTKRITVGIAAEAWKMLGSTQAVAGSSRSPRSEFRKKGSDDPLKRRYQVFVSSTFEDLKEERRHVLQALLETKCIPTGMELFPASSEDRWDLIKRVIDDCDYYLVIVAGRYGSRGLEGTSFTEMEFDYAAASGKSIIAFYHSNPDDLIGSKLEKNDEGRQKLTAFTRKIKKSRMCKPWRTPEGLASAIKSAILYSIEYDRKPGWARASDLPSAAAIADLKETLESKAKKRITRRSTLNQ